MRRFALALSVAAFVPTIAFADGTPTTFCELVKMVVNILNALTSLMVLAAVVAYVYGITMNIKSAGESKTNLKTIILWGIAALFLMVSIWGVLHILQDTLFPTQSPSGAATC